MATKSQRILDLLPGTFAAQPVRSPLVTLVRSYGGELQGAENALAAIMRAHWVDHADFGAPKLDDLPRFAALYGLAPHPDEEIEEFRRRLKLWVRLILEGPANVRGLLRATSILTGLETDDSDAALDAWWRRPDDSLTVSRFSGRDAGRAIFGFDRGAATGADAAAARITGNVPLSDPVELGSGSTLRIALDSDAPVTIDLSTAPAAASPAEVVDRINEAIGAEIARLDGTRLELASPTSGPGGRIALLDGPDDAAPALFGLPPRRAFGSDARGARIAGAADLSSGIDLSDERFLRLRIDGTQLAEVDCAGADPSATTLDDVVGAINAALGAGIASHDGQHLVLTSPTVGGSSSIAFLSPAAQDASTVLFGPHPTIVIGADAAPATIIGTANLAAGVDLTGGAILAISYDAEPEVEVNCAGADPARSQLPEIVSAINAALGATIARHNGRNLILNGLRTNATGVLEVGHAGERDGSRALLGLLPRRAEGQAATRAALRGAVDLTEGVSLAARPLLRLAIDHRPPRIFDLADKAEAGPLDAPAIAAALGELQDAPEAFAEDGRLVLRSATEGSGGAIELLPVANSVTRRFVSRVPILEDAAMAVLAFLSARAVGTPATKARITGTKDLRRGVDLSAGRHLRLAVDGAAPVEIDCAGPRPRNTTADEVVAAINTALGEEIASLSGEGRLTLTSPSSGAQSSLALSPPRAADALETVLGVGPITARGRAALQVSFTGTVDLSAGVDLSTASHLRLAVDGGDAVEIDCAGPDPQATTLSQIAIAINVAMGRNIASHDGVHVLLTSPKKGADSELAILAPADDATAKILGIEPERRYRGAVARSAEIRGLVDLLGGVDLTTARFLRLKVDTAAPVEIDCAAEAEDASAATPDEIAAAINAALPAAIASVDAGHLVLRAPNPGASSLLVLEETLSGDAAGALLGAVPGEVSGEPAGPAKLEGRVDLRNGVDLSERSVLRLSLDDAPPSDIDLAGEAPEFTAPDEIVAAINARHPQMAEVSADGRLILTASEGASLSLMPLRHFELVDYPPTPISRSASGLVHGDALFLDNAGAAAAPHDTTIFSKDGAGSPGLVDLDNGWELRLRGALPPGATARIRPGKSGLVATVTAADGHVLSEPRIEALPLLPHLASPADEHRTMAAGASGRRQIVLSGADGPELIRLTEIGRRDSAPRIEIVAAQALPDEAPEGTWLGRLVEQNGALALDDLDDQRIATIEPLGERSGTAPVGALVAVRARRIGQAEPPHVLAQSIRALVDVGIYARDEPPVEESFAAVTLSGEGPLSLVDRINGGPAPSSLVFADPLDPAAAHTLPLGPGRRLYVDCLSARFDSAKFDQARFAGGPCLEQGIFNVSRFAETPHAKSTPVFAPASGGGTADVTLDWQGHAVAACAINLPHDMPARFGARFDMDRFALAEDAPESITGLVTEPPGDPDHFAERLAEGASASLLVSAKPASFVPIGFAPIEMPFARPQFLTGGNAAGAARLYLSDPGVPGFIELSASLPGAHGNRISVVACDAGPGRFDLNVTFAGARFENARQRVLGAPLTGTPADFLNPAPRGVLHLKAAGVRIEVTRDGTPPEHTDCQGDR